MVTSYWQWYNGLTEQQKREVDLQEYEEELEARASRGRRRRRIPLDQKIGDDGSSISGGRPVGRHQGAYFDDEIW